MPVCVGMETSGIELCDCFNIPDFEDGGPNNDNPKDRVTFKSNPEEPGFIPGYLRLNIYRPGKFDCDSLDTPEDLAEENYCLYTWGNPRALWPFGYGRGRIRWDTLRCNCDGEPWIWSGRNVVGRCDRYYLEGQLVGTVAIGDGKVIVDIYVVLGMYIGDYCGSNPASLKEYVKLDATIFHGEKEIDRSDWIDVDGKITQSIQMDNEFTLPGDCAESAEEGSKYKILGGGGHVTIEILDSERSQSPDESYEPSFVVANKNMRPSSECCGGGACDEDEVWDEDTCRCAPDEDDPPPIPPPPPPEEQQWRELIRCADDRRMGRWTNRPAGDVIVYQVLSLTEYCAYVDDETVIGKVAPGPTLEDHHVVEEMESCVDCRFYRFEACDDDQDVTYARADQITGFDPEDYVDGNGDSNGKALTLVGDETCRFVKRVDGAPSTEAVELDEAFDDCEECNTPACECDDSHASVDLVIPSDITSSSVAKLPAGTYNLTQTSNRCTDGPDPNAFLYDGAHEATDGSFWVMEVIYGLDEKGDVFCMDAYIYNVSAGDNELIYQNNTTLGEYDDPTVPADITAHPTTVEVAEVP